MREIRKSGSEGGGAGNSTGSPYPYHAVAPPGAEYVREICRRGWADAWRLYPEGASLSLSRPKCRPSV